MIPRQFTTLLAFTSAVTLFADKPNFVFIFTDDQSYTTIHALGNSEIKTPNLDRLVEQGVSFENAYNMGSWVGAVCVASRTMLNTGRALWRAEAIDDRKQAAVLAENGQTWSQLLKTAGYETYMSGKWHVKINTGDIFDHVLHERPGMPNQTPEGYQRPIEGQPDPWSPYDPKFGGFWKGGKHWSEVLADDARVFIDQAAGGDKPFFMYLAFNAPHDPRQAPKEFVDMYPLDTLSLPGNFLPEYPYKQEIGCYMLEKNGEMVPQRDENLAPHPRTPYAVKVHKQEYYAAVSHVDAQIGKIIAALEKKGLLDNTYIFMSADHGLACGSHGLLGKQNMYEHSMRPPLIVVGPDVPEGERRDAFVYLQDIMATTLDLAGVQKPVYVDFNSLMPLIENPSMNSQYDAVYGAFNARFQRMVRVDDHKLILYPDAGVVRLYNLAEDPLETTDLAGNPEFKPLIRQLFNQLLVLQRQMDDPLDLAAEYPELVTK